ncbi:hypothetical protein QAD02_004526 [Eretmocerus hayati]|uniref:Uncharacterized protein n=1 Tax=Eretmocerus hayati TaxID=131215 RepID=A0ACC2NSI0_9HYME|nr:hypothetical protein QAD02_004526 [Eretmocerus hayati]
MSARDGTPIAYLNDDCLLHIFEFTSIQDKLNIELVCKRWQRVCESAWKKVNIFHPCSDEFGFSVPENDLGPEAHWVLPAVIIDVPICQRVFENCHHHLKKISLSRIENLEITTLMDVWHYCSMNNFYEWTRAGTLDELKNLLLECEKVEELWLCRCVVNVDDVFLGKLFAKNRNLKKLVLIELKLTGECFSQLSSDVLESLVLFECIISQPEYLNATISSASKLQILSLNCNGKDPFTHETVTSPTSEHNLLGMNDTGEYDIRNSLLLPICKLKNLTILSLRHSEVDDLMLETISLACLNVKVLDIELCGEVTNDGLQYTQSMPKLKCLNISLNEELSDAGLLTVNKNLEIFRMSQANISERALLTLLWEMKNLKALDVSNCLQLSNRFVELAIQIVKLRKEKIPLKIGLSGPNVNIDTVKNVCPLIQLSTWFTVDYQIYCSA